jgi:hypothetical protein
MRRRPRLRLPRKGRKKEADTRAEAQGLSRQYSPLTLESSSGSSGEESGSSCSASLHPVITGGENLQSDGLLTVFENMVGINALISSDEESDWGMFDSIDRSLNVAPTTYSVPLHKSGTLSSASTSPMSLVNVETFSPVLEASMGAMSCSPRKLLLKRHTMTTNDGTDSKSRINKLAELDSIGSMYRIPDLPMSRRTTAGTSLAIASGLASQSRDSRATTGPPSEAIGIIQRKDFGQGAQLDQCRVETEKSRSFSSQRAGSIVADTLKSAISSGVVNEVAASKNISETILTNVTAGLLSLNSMQEQSESLEITQEDFSRAIFISDTSKCIERQLTLVHEEAIQAEDLEVTQDFFTEGFKRDQDFISIVDQQTSLENSPAVADACTAGVEGSKGLGLFNKIVTAHGISNNRNVWDRNASKKDASSAKVSATEVSGPANGGLSFSSCSTDPVTATSFAKSPVAADACTGGVEGPKGRRLFSKIMAAPGISKIRNVWERNASKKHASSAKLSATEVSGPASGGLSLSCSTDPVTATIGGTSGQMSPSEFRRNTIVINHVESSNDEGATECSIQVLQRPEQITGKSALRTIDDDRSHTSEIESSQMDACGLACSAKQEKSSIRNGRRPTPTSQNEELSCASTDEEDALNTYNEWRDRPDARHISGEKIVVEHEKFAISNPVLPEVMPLSMNGRLRVDTTSDVQDALSVEVLLSIATVSPKTSTSPMVTSPDIRRSLETPTPPPHVPPRSPVAKSMNKIFSALGSRLPKTKIYRFKKEDKERSALTQATPTTPTSSHTTTIASDGIRPPDTDFPDENSILDASQGGLVALPKLGATAGVVREEAKSPIILYPILDFNPCNENLGFANEVISDYNAFRFDKPDTRSQGSRDGCRDSPYSTGESSPLLSKIDQIHRAGEWASSNNKSGGGLANFEPSKENKIADTPNSAKKLGSTIRRVIAKGKNALTPRNRPNSSQGPSSPGQKEVSIGNHLLEQPDSNNKSGGTGKEVASFEPSKENKIADTPNSVKKLGSTIRRVIDKGKNALTPRNRPNSSQGPSSPGQKDVSIGNRLLELPDSGHPTSMTIKSTEWSVNENDKDSNDLPSKPEYGEGEFDSRRTDSLRQAKYRRIMSRIEKRRRRDLNDESSSAAAKLIDESLEALVNRLLKEENAPLSSRNRVQPEQQTTEPPLGLFERFMCTCACKESEM